MKAAELSQRRKRRRPIEGCQLSDHHGDDVIEAVALGVDAGRAGEPLWTWMGRAREPVGAAAQ